MKTRHLVQALALASLCGFAPGSGADHPHRILAINGFYGVDGTLLGDAHPINGLPGDDLPWVVKDGRGWLNSNGHLHLRIKGLVFADDPKVPPDLQGKNDEPTFRAVVSGFMISTGGGGGGKGEGDGEGDEGDQGEDEGCGDGDGGGGGGGGGLVNVQLITEGFAATESGDCAIDTDVTLPDTFLMPSVLIISGSEKAWFAVNGIETGEE